MNLSCLILAGGIGSRFHSKTPKVVHPLLGKPMLLWSVDAGRSAGAAETVVVVSSAIREAVENTVSKVPGVRLALQHEPCGTGDAVRCGITAGLSGDTVLVLCGDTPLLRGESLAEACAAHRHSGALATVLSMRLAKPGSYGRVVRDAQGSVLRIVEARDAGPEELALDEVNTGAWLFQRLWLEAALPGLRPDNAQAELYLTDLLAVAAAQGKAGAWTAPHSEDFLGINDRVEFTMAWELMQQRILRQLQLSGVTLVGHGFCIEPQVAVAADTILYAPCTLTGTTRIEHACVLETGAVLHDTILHCHAHIKPYCVLEGCEVAHGASVGPFARLRPGAMLEKNAKVGNFVEIKKSVIHEGAKVSHLSYIGDADVGAGANIGAGTITCNYDGVDKHRTEIGAGAFIGSNTALVAPVKVGAHAVVGAGSTVTRDVPEDALCVERCEEKIVPGYSRRRSHKPEPGKPGNQ